MTKNITFQQIFNMIRTHFFVCGIFFLLGLVIFAGIITNKTGAVIYSIICIPIYFFSIYNCAVRICQRDKKTYTEQTPFKLKGLILPVGLLFVSVILYLLYFVTWEFMTVNGALFSFQGYFNNILFILWTFPYTGVIQLSNGTMAWYGYILVALLPFVASFSGYLMTYNNLDINTAFSKIIYKSNEKENNK